MSVRIDSLDTIVKKLKWDESGEARAFLTETCYKAMDKYVPKRNGDLRTVVDLRTNSITYQSPYAEYQYYGERADGSHQVQNYTTPGTGPYWDERMISADMDSVIEKVQERYGR